jgi:aspartyl-tRNA(Asn)/glutamyl-tRNA(Gln) amidotransferase subunit A
MGTIDGELLRRLAEGILGRGVEPQAVADSLPRLESILTWVRGLDEERLRGLGPAGLLNVAHPGWQVAPPAEPAWQTVVPTGRGSGYGAPPPRRVAGAAPAPGTAEPAPAEVAAGWRDLPPAGRPIPEGLLSRPAAEVARSIARREVSPSEVLEATLARIEELAPALNAFITVTAERARARARQATEELARGGARGPLFGLPVAVKDIIETAGVRTTCGSRILRDYVPAADATVVRRMEAAGAIVVGKTNMHEFAFGPTTVNPHYGVCRNPHNPACVSGGSSGGSAVAVATGQAYLALGTDTGGSIRIPSACCGAVGLKPTYGRVSKAGIFPLSWSLDHAGPLGRGVADVALALEVLAGADPLDPSTATAPPPGGYLDAAESGARGGLRGLAIGMPRGWLECRVTPGVAAAVSSAVERLRSLGAAVREIEFPGPDPMMLANRLIVLAEAAAFHLPWLRRVPGEYGPDVRARLELGQYLMAVDYLAGQRLRGELCRSVAAAMRDVDLLVTPALPAPAPYIGQDYFDWPDGRETVPDGLIRLVAPFNVTGQPALSMPCGLDAGRPVGLQIVGRWFEEGTVLRAAAALEASAG